MADLYITVSTNRLSASSQVPLPEEVVRFADSLPQVRAVDALKRIRTTYRGRTIAVNGARLSLPRNDVSLAFEDGSWEEVMKALDGGAIAVSEGFALWFDKSVGDTIDLRTPSGDHTLNIAGIYYDYASDAGTIMMKKPLFAALYGDSSSNNLALYLSDSSRIGPTREAIERRFGAAYSLIVYSNRSLRDEALRVFDQTFAITYALQLVAIIVAAIGVANTLAALVMERSREIGILKAVGATGRQVRKMTLVQAGLIGLASQSLGIVAGMGLSAILIFVINRVSFGWTIQFRISPEVIGVSTVLVLVTALLAGLGPAGTAARKRVADVVKAE
jgi:putative ABC transport system permease protein